MARDPGKAAGLWDWEAAPASGIKAYFSSLRSGLCLLHPLCRSTQEGLAGLSIRMALILDDSFLSFPRGHAALTV